MGQDGHGSVDADIGIAVDGTLVDPPTGPGHQLPDTLGRGVDLDAAVDPVQRVDVGGGMVHGGAPRSLGSRATARLHIRCSDATYRLHPRELERGTEDSDPEISFEIRGGSPSRVRLSPVSLARGGTL